MAAVGLSRWRSTGRSEAGSFVAMPHACLNHPNYTRLSPRAVKLLFDLYAQFRGNNNGDFTAAWSYMSKHGWHSKDQLNKATRELLTAGWIMLTRQGGRNQCSLYAVTFQAIDDCKGKLDEPATTTAPGWWKRDPIAPQHGSPISKAVPRHTGQVDPLHGAQE